MATSGKSGSASVANSALKLGSKRPPCATVSAVRAALQRRAHIAKHKLGCSVDLNPWAITKLPVAH